MSVTVCENSIIGIGTYNPIVNNNTNSLDDSCQQQTTPSESYFTPMSSGEDNKSQPVFRKFFEKSLIENNCLKKIQISMTFTKYQEPNVRKVFLLNEEMNTISKKDNLKKIEEFKNLKFNWNDNDAKPFEQLFIKKICELLEKIYVQPKLFPCADNSIQFEYYDRKYTKKYLEFGVYSEYVFVFMIDKDGKEKETFFPKTDIDEINNIICDFYVSDNCAR